jgi:hypothetical protein
MDLKMESTTQARDSATEQADLKRIGAAILASGPNLHDAFLPTEELRKMAERLSGVDFSGNADTGVGQSDLPSGLAISPMMAAWCARESLRSAAFIQGAAAALQQAARERAGCPLRVLYAGCGPFALLVLPLMALWPASFARFTLLDIHGEALDYARTLVSAVGLDDRVAAWVEADATTYRIDPDAMPDVIISETMTAALAHEPQVAIARHLLAQAPGALMVPATVRVDCMLCDHVKEKPNAIAPQRDRIHLGKVFELNAESIAQWSGLGQGPLPAGAVTLPPVLEPRYHLRLMTHIDVFNGIVLADYACSLNTPRFLPGKPAFKGGEALEFSYRLGADPGIDFRVLAS